MSSRSDFNESWLTETPKNTGAVETFVGLEYNINDLKKYGYPPTDLGNGYKKFELFEYCYYWFENEENQEIILAVELQKKPENYTVTFLGKNSKYRNTAPYASDLYIKILNDSKILLIKSDSKLSESGLKVWEKLFTLGYKISIYDKSNINTVGQSMKTIKTQDELNSYFGKDKKYSNYQFVLSNPSQIGEYRNFFNNRRLRELAGMDLED